MLNWKVYRELNDDLIKAGLNTEKQIIDHWNRYGHKESRKIKITDAFPDFNLENYKHQNPNLILDNTTDYELHYIISQKLKVIPNLKLAIVSIFKNESHILEEWIEHYFREGIDTIFLIDNGSTDNYIHVLKKYIDIGKVILNIDNMRYAQSNLYNKYYLEQTKKYDWVMVVDLDEFMYSRKLYGTIKDYLTLVPSNVDQIYVPWKFFGSNGHLIQPDSVIQGFTKRITGNKQVLGKTIVRCSKLKQLDIHASLLNDTSGIRISSDNIIHADPNNAMVDISEDILKNSYLHLNHYAIQSWEWFKKIKMTRGDVTTPNHDNTRNENYFKSYDNNDKFDNELATKIIVINT